MKRIVAVLMGIVLGISMSRTASAETKEELWLSYTKTGTALTVEVKSLGNVADGLSELSYDSDVLSCETAVPSDSVEMCSINKTKAGELKFSYLSERAIPEGTMLTVQFQIAAGHEKDAVRLAFHSTIHGEDGAELKAANGPLEIPGGDRETPAEPIIPAPVPDSGAPAEMPKAQTAGEPATGDKTGVESLFLTLLAGVAGMVAALYKKDRNPSGREEQR